jgi:putative membrane protein
MRAAAITLGLILMCVPASAQIGNPAGMAPDTRMQQPGVPAPGQSNYQDQLFAQLAASGGSAEIELSKLAADRSSQDAVRRFAERMVNDHRKANESLTRIAGQSDIPLPSEVDEDHKRILANLENLDGAEFDRAYLAAQIVDHQKTAQVLAWEIGSGQNADLQQFASEVLPTVLEHLELARRTQAQLASGALAVPASSK